MTLKTQRKAKAAPEAYKVPPTGKPRKSAPKMNAKANGKHSMAIYEHLHVGIVEASPEGSYIDVNEEFCRILGYSKEELLRLGIQDCTHEEDHGLDIRLHQQLVAGKIPSYALEKRYVRKDGGIVWVELTRSLTRDEAGKPLYTIGVVIDISDRKHVESVLRESVEHLRLATEAARMFKWEFDFQTQMYSLADNFEQVLGFSAGLMPKNSIETLMRLSPAEDLEAATKLAAQTIENRGDLHSLQYRIMNPEDGRRVWLEVNAKVVYDEAGQPQRMFGVAQNITESKRAEDELRIVSRMPMENPNPVIRLTPEGEVLYANPASLPLVESWQQRADQAAPEELRKALAEAFAAGVKREIEIEHGANFFSCTLAPIREAGYVNLYGKDITLRKQAEEKLRRSEQRFRAIVSQATAGIAEGDSDARMTFVNPRFCEMLGYSEAELLGKTIWEFTYADDLDDNRRLFERLMAQDEFYDFEKRFVRKDGSILWANVSVTKILGRAGESTGAVGVIVDISEHKRAEQALAEFARQQEALYRLSDDLHHTGSLEAVYNAALNAILSGLQCDRASILLFDESGVMRFAAWRGLSEQYRQATEGHSPWTVAEQDPAPICVTDIRTADLDEALKATIEKEGIQSLVFIPLVSNGKLIGKFMVYFDTLHQCSDVEIELSLMIARQLAFGIDQKRAEVELRESEERYRGIVNQTIGGIAETDLTGTFLMVNDHFCEIIGYPREELLNGMRMQDVTYPEDRARNLNMFKELAVNGASFTIEKRYVRPDGSLVWVHNSVSAITGPDGKPRSAVAMVLDVTERRHAEEQLRASAEFDAFRVALTDALRPLSDPGEILAEAMRVLGEKLQVDRVLYSEIEEDDETIRILDNYVQDGVQKLTGRASLDDYGKARNLLSSGRNLIIVDAATSPEMDEKDRATFATLGIRSGLGIPLIKSRRWVATLGIHHGVVRDWTPNEIRFVEETAERTWSALERARAQERLRASESLYRTIARSIPDGGVYVVDKDFRYLVAEGPATEAFGLTREMLEGRRISEVFPDERGVRMEQRLQRVFSGETINFETKNNGRVYWTQLAPLQDSIGQAIILTLDITERKQAEEALEREREVFERLFETMPVMVSMYDPETESLQLNAEFERVLGWKTEEVNILSLVESIYPDPDYRLHVVQRMAAAGRNEWVDARLRTRDGRTLETAWSNASILNGMQIGIGIDLTERKRIEEALRIENERFMRFVDSNIVGILIGNASGEVLLANDYYLNLLGVSRQDLLEKKVDWKQFTPPEWLPADQEAIRQLQERGVCDPYEKEYVRADGTRVPVYIADALLPGSGGEIAAFVLDITERKRAEDALRQSEERFVRFMQHLPGLAWIKDIHGCYVFVNPAAEKAFGVPRARLYGKTDSEVFPAEVASQFQKNDEQARRYEKGVQTVEILPQGDGIVHYSLVNKFPIPGVDGKVALIGGTAFDITERLQAEEALRESEARFRAIISQATAGIVRKDAEGRLTFVNEAFCNMLGYPESELLGRTFWEFTYDEDIEENRRLYQRLMMEGIPFKLEKRLLRADGALIWVDLSVSPVMDGDGKPQSAVAIEVDITGRKKAEEALQQLNLQLESRVQKRTATIQAMNQSLREEIAERKRIEEALRLSEAGARASEEKLRTLFDLLPVGISFLSPEGQVLEMNSALTSIIRLSKAQLLSQSYKSRKYIRADGTPMPLNEFASARALADGKTIYNVETGVVLENGETIWTSVSAAPVDVAEVGVVVVTVDITESKRAERALQESHRRLGTLSQRLVEVQEEERRALARELHDRVGQTLAALNINLIIINSQLSGEAAQQIGGRLNDSMKLVAETIALVRDVMTDLRPAVLDDYGLEAALEAQLSKFTSRYNIKTTLEKPTRPIPRLGPSIEMTFLRIAQEALVNIARHAQAEHVNLTLQQEARAVCLTIRDDGIGIGSWQDANRPGSHGMKIMRERAEAFGGQLHVRSMPNQGTIVEVTIPFKNEGEKQSGKEGA